METYPSRTEQGERRVRDGRTAREEKLCNGPWIFKNHGEGGQSPVGKQMKTRACVAAHTPTRDGGPSASLRCRFARHAGGSELSAAAARPWPWRGRRPVPQSGGVSGSFPGLLAGRVL